MLWFYKPLTSFLYTHIFQNIVLENKMRILNAGEMQAFQVAQSNMSWDLIS